MVAESIVYGYIKNESSSDYPIDLNPRLINRKVLIELPVANQADFLSRDIFSMPTLMNRDDSYQSHVIHFGCVYSGIEYEWSLWLKNFERLLQKMVWRSVVVHLETEISGLHTFIWDSGSHPHTPSLQPLKVICEWQHEYSL